MRRFEYIDDKSAKFWEIEQADASLNIRWGRIGTAGQSQTKAFADAAKASAALLKLVAEKTAKGYLEQAATAGASIGAVPAKPPLAEPDPAPADIPATPVDARGAASPPVDAGHPPWLAQGEALLLGDAADSTRKLAWATRRHPQPIDTVDPARSWEELRGMIGAEIEADFNGSDPALRDAFEAAWRTLDDPAPVSTLDEDALLLAVCLKRRGYRNSALDVKLVDHLVARQGLRYALKALLAAAAYAVDDNYAGSGKFIMRVHERASAPTNYYYRSVSDGQWRLRTYLAAAPQDTYDACAAMVKDAIATVPPESQIALAILFPDLPNLSHGVIAQLCADGATPPHAIQWLQLNATDPEALARTRIFDIDSYESLWRHEESVATILVERGIEAVRWLAPAAEHDHAGEALTRIGIPEALEALARAAGKSKPALARFTLAARRWPVAAMAALARVLGTTRANSRNDGSLLMPTLVDLVHSQPALPALLQPWLEPAANALLDSLAERMATPADVAALDELPEVLARVPWLQPKKKAAQALQLAVLPLPAVEIWDEGERERFATLSDWQKNHYRAAMQSPDAMAEKFGFEPKHPELEFRDYFKAARAAIAEGNAEGLIAARRAMLEAGKNRGRRYYNYTFDGWAAALLPPALGIPFWNAAASESPCNGIYRVAATWGLQALPGIVARIASSPSEHFDLALRIGAVELAPIAARVFTKLKTLRHLGRQWLERYPEHAACALIAPALGKPTEARDCAASSLRHLAASGHAALLDEVAGRYGKPEVLAALHAVLSESALDRYPNKRAALPAFWKPRGWTRPCLQDGKALPDDALDVIGTMMMFPTTEEVYAGLYQVKAACTADSLAGFAWDCFSAWLNAGAPPREVWAMLNLGLFGSDDTARKLTPMIRAWPGEGGHARAVTALDVLAGIGSDVALMLLNGIAQKVKFKGLQDKAREKIDLVAEARGLSAEELEDRLAPDLGLDEHGSMILDFGPRAFKVAFDESLKPYVREWQDGKPGARLPDLPKPKKTDDEELAAAATERFKRLKRDARTIASQQVLRLEVAMCSRRRWSPDVFAQFMAQHPLVRHLVRRLVWGVYAMPVEIVGEGTDQERRVASHGGSLQACFRVAEDGEYTSAADDPFALPEGEQFLIGLPHALELPAADIADFTQLLADYELLQPFPQLGRDTYALTEAERKTERLLRWKDIKVATGKVLGLSNLGWRRGTTEDSGVIGSFGKEAGGKQLLELRFEPGIIVDTVDHFPEQTLGDVSIGGGSRWHRDTGLPTFDTLDAIVASELIRDMERLRS